MVSSASLKLLYITFLLYIICSCTFSQTNDPTEETKESTDDTFSAPWLFTMVISGMFGVIFVAVVGIHSIYHFHKDKTNEGVGRALYIIFFVSYWLTCVGYGLFRIDVMFPMGSLIDCKLGFYLTTNGVFLSKLALFTIFVYRIDLSFHSSALGYPRPALVSLMVIYIILILALNAWFIYLSWPMIKLVSAHYTILNNNDFLIGMCTVGTDTSQNLYTLTLGVMFLLDTIFTVLVCCLFVCKLLTVLKMSRGDSSFGSQSANEKQRTSKLTKVIRKQTILVCVASISSFLVFLGGALFVPGLSLTMPIDAMINVLCVYLMFSFADALWNKIIKCCCCCCGCACCGKKEDYFMTMRTLRGLSSMRSRIGSTTPVNSPEDDSNAEKAIAAMERMSKHHMNNSNEPLSSIADRNSEKHAELEINFDLQKNQQLSVENEKEIELESQSKEAQT